MKIHLKNGAPPPEDPNYFIVAKNGTFLRKRTGWVDAVVPVQSLDILQEQKVEATLLLPPVKSTTFAKAVLFFHAIYKKQGTESAILLHYSPKLGWELTVPKQKADPTSVNYEMDERLPGYQCVGTMHSHCAMSAFHSSTDIYDEANLDGVHITIGLLDRFPNFGVDAEFVVNGTRFRLPKNGVTRLRDVVEADVPEVHESFAFMNPFPLQKKDSLYTIPFGIVRDWTVPDEWIARVKKRSTWGAIPVPRARRKPVSTANALPPPGLTDFSLPPVVAEDTQ